MLESILSGKGKPMNPKPRLKCQLDHLVVCAHSCEAAVHWFEKLSGVTMPQGGRHPLMATHNHLTALSTDTFLEIIAIDPQAEPVSRARWFELDDPARGQSLNKGPALRTWVARTNDLGRAMQAAIDAGIDPGVPVELSRGNLNWRLALRTDGSLALGGLFPILIQWPEGVNPVDQMQDQGVRLDQLMLGCADAALLQNALLAIGAADLVTVMSENTGMMANMHAGARQFQLSD